MPKRILVDASHREETRVVVLQDGRVEEFESETAIKEQLKGNIYLAKITRVEPSLQAAFVDYGGGRHGFLPFQEIHPDYYNIFVAHKKELLENLRNLHKSDEDEDTEETESVDNIDNISKEESYSDNNSHDHSEELRDNTESDIAVEVEANNSTTEHKATDRERVSELNLYRKYKIQDVIKRNQIILVQVEKEERGNKGASLTTFISLAGRYCVLMPNSLRKGGVSRRIGSFEDRKRLKQIIGQLDIPEDVGLIVRTAGSGKSAEQIRQDYDYLVNLWNNIRQATLQSTAPAFIHVEGDIIKRTLRDWFDEGIDEVLIEGDKPFQSAIAFMKEVMPEQISRVKSYKNKVPLFSRYRIEEQIASLYSQQVILESGGSLVIMPTEALISIDVNSGKLTNTRNVEDTATNTNLEAAREIARQLRLRNLSGLIVIDFIDMTDLRNKKAVERELKQAFFGDRARVQVGRISSFGLLEVSRQRLSASFIEVNAVACSHCKGVGFVKAAGSIAVNALRAIEHEISKGAACEEVTLFVSVDVAMYIVNHKRHRLALLEQNYNVKIIMAQRDKLSTSDIVIEKTKLSTNQLNKSNQQEVKDDSLTNPQETTTQNYSKNKNKSTRGELNDAVRVDTKNHQNDKNALKDCSNKPKKVGMFEGLWQKLLD